MEKTSQKLDLERLIVFALFVALCISISFNIYQSIQIRNDEQVIYFSSKRLGNETWYFVVQNNQIMFSSQNASEAVIYGFGLMKK